MTLIFQSNIPFSTKAQPVAIYESAASLIGQNVEASGWGALTEGGGTPNDLYAVQMPVVTKADSQYSTTSTYNDALMLIAGTKTGMRHY